MRRREFITLAAAAVAADAKTLNGKERVDRALQGKGVDRTPFTFRHHYGLKTPQEHVKATLDFHARYRTDIVKVMSDFPYPRPQGPWHELKEDDNPFPAQIRALEQIRAGLTPKALKGTRKPNQVTQIVECCSWARRDRFLLAITDPYLPSMSL